MPPEPDAQVDGRRARRERSRAAVVDAVFELVHSGKIPPTVEDVAELSGVSVSSVFRNFDGLDDMQRHAFEVFSERFAHLFEPAAVATTPRSERVAQHVKRRVELLEIAGPLMRVARHRALDYEPMVEAVARSRSKLARQTRTHFVHEVAQLTPAEASNLLALLDAVTSPEAYEVMQAAHGRSGRQISRTWGRAIEAILDGWPGLDSEPSTQGELPK